MGDDRISAHFEASLSVMTTAAGDAALMARTREIANVISATLGKGGKLLIAGNGGSAADAQHIAAEFVGRYKMERRAWPAIALTTDTSALTAITNDYSFESVFARQIEGLGRRGDVFWGWTTSGKSPNILAAFRISREIGLVTIGFTGMKGAAMVEYCDHLFVSPSDDTPLVQQIHMVAGHAICDQVENALLSSSANEHCRPQREL